MKEENKQRSIKNYIDDELTSIRIHIEELEGELKTFDTSLTKVKKLVASLIGSRNV